MTSVSLSHRDETGRPAKMPASERRCLVTGEVRAKADLIRFVLDPEGRVVPDLTARLPGRGLWISADKAALQQAVAKNLFSRAAKTKAVVSPDLLVQLDVLFARRCLELLGLARGAGAVITGEPQVLDARANGVLAGLMLAADAGRDIRKKLSREDIATSGFTRTQLGAALGHDHLVAVGLRPHPLTDKLLAELARWHGARGADDFSTEDNGTVT